MGDKSGVRIASDSSIEIDFYYRGVRCRERLKLKPTPQNLKYATKLKASIELEIGKGTFDYRKHFPDSRKIPLFSGVAGDAITIETYLRKWLEEEKQNVRHSTWQGYRPIVEGTIIPVFGKLRLSELNRRHIKDWMASRTDILPKTLGNILSPLRIALDGAVEDELIEASPLAGWQIKRLKQSKTRGLRRSRYEPDPFSIEEQVAIFNTMRDQNFNMTKFAFWTGLRTSELCGLDWPEIDWIRGVVRVRFVLTAGLKEPEENTKTMAGQRDVKLLPPALEALVAQKRFTFLKNQEVFQDPKTDERWMGPYPVREMWVSALKRAKVRYRSPYQTRHTYASTLLQAGEPVQWVAQQMGHKNWAFTAKTYSRWIPDNAPEAGAKAAALWSHWSTSGQHGS